MLPREATGHKGPYYSAYHAIKSDTQWLSLDLQYFNLIKFDFKFTFLFLKSEARSLEGKNSAALCVNLNHMQEAYDSLLSF